MEFQWGIFLEILSVHHWERHLVQNMELRQALLMTYRMVMLMEDLKAIHWERLLVHNLELR